MNESSASLSRRDLLTAASAGVVTAVAMPDRVAAQDKSPAASDRPFGLCLNMSTIREQKLSVPEQIELAATAGYDGIEPWMGELHRFVEQGGKPAELRHRIADQGLQVASAIGFAEWIVDDDAKRRQGLETAKRDMDMLR